MANKVVHRAETRGHANHGWLDAHHSFSFANYYDPDKVNFGALRVLNDDIIQGGMGFSTHPHDNMEIVTIPLYGALRHKDSMGNTAVINANDVQIMSAGTGVSHSEVNANQHEAINLLQIWVFPKVRNLKPSYQQITFNPEDRLNRWVCVVSPEATGEGVTIHQDAWFSLGRFTAGMSLDYTLHSPNSGVYAFVIDGEVATEGELLKRRDAMGIWDTERLNFTAQTAAEVLLLEVPMIF